MKRHKALLALAVSVGLLAVPVTAQAAGSNVQVRYDTTFTYLGGNRWTVSANNTQFALHNIGGRQSWLCNANNVGAGISACVPGKAYETTGEAYADGSGSCVYVQGDSPAWDTVPGDPTKRVCADEPAPEPEPVVPVTPVEPTPEPSTDPEPTPEPTEPTEPTPTPVDPSTPVEPDPEPSESVDPTPVPAQPTGTATATPATTTTQTSKQADTKTASAPAESLATTGSDPKPIALAATVLLIIGAGLVGFAGRRRR